MKRTLMFALLLAAAGIASAQSPAPFDMNQERGPERLPSAPPVTTPGARPLSPAPPVSGDARIPAAGQPTPARPPSASSELAARRYLVPDRTLQLRGEGEQRSWSIYLTPDQAAAPAKLHVGYQNSIVVAPETSRLAVVINDMPIHNDQISSPER